MWKRVIGYERHYEVSEHGEVRRVGSGRGAKCGRLISTKRKSAKGYRVAELCVNDVKHRMFLHRIVCQAFHGQPPTASHVVNHIDGVKANCNASNLEWVTAKENAEHAARIGLLRPMRGESNGRSKLTKRDVAEIRSLQGIVGARAIAIRFGVARSLVQRIHQGRAWAWPEDLRVRELPV